MITTRAHGTIAQSLTQILEELPVELRAQCVDVRSFAPGSASSVLHHRAARTGASARDSILDHSQMSHALASGEAAVLEDLVGEDTIQSWLLVPVTRQGDGTATCALVGCGCNTYDVEAEHLAQAEESFAFLAEDVTDSQAAPHAPTSQIANAIAEAVPMPVLVANADGNVLSANQNFRLVFGCANEVVNSRLQTLLPQQFSAVFTAALRATLQRNASVELPLPPFEGPLQGLTYTLTTALDDNLGDPVVIFVMREVSAGLQLSQLRESNDMKEFLFRTLLHDMKTPLSAIINGVELLRGMMPPDGQSACGDLLWAIDSSGNRIKLLLEDMNEYFLLRFQEEGELFCTVALADVIEPLLRVYRMQGLPHTFTVEIEGDGHVVGDEYRINRAIDNIVSNAVKYAPSGEIHVRVRRPDHDDFVAVEISDQGPGIPSEFLDKIWDPFYRLRSAASDGIEGSGLGLSITRHIVEGQGGTIEAYSRPGEGTTFVVRLQHAGA